MNRSALVILPEGFEEIEAIVPINLMRRARIDVTVTSREMTRAVRGRSDIIVQADCLLNAVIEQSSIYDALVLPGGPGIVRLQQDARVHQLVEQHAAAGRLIAAICAAPLVLHDLGLLRGRRYTAHFSVSETLPERVKGADVIVDRTILTASGPGAAVAFGLTIIAQLLDSSAAEKVAAAIDCPKASRYWK